MSERSTTDQITCHILDQTRGIPAVEVPVYLQFLGFEWSPRAQRRGIFKEIDQISSPDKCKCRLRAQPFVDLSDAESDTDDEVRKDTYSGERQYVLVPELWPEELRYSKAEEEARKRAQEKAKKKADDAAKRAAQRAAREQAAQEDGSSTDGRTISSTDGAADSCAVAGPAGPTINTADVGTQTRCACGSSTISKSAESSSTSTPLTPVAPTAIATVGTADSPATTTIPVPLSTTATASSPSSGPSKLRRPPFLWSAITTVEGRVKAWNWVGPRGVTGMELEDVLFRISEMGGGKTEEGRPVPVFRLTAKVSTYFTMMRSNEKRSQLALYGPQKQINRQGRKWFYPEVSVTFYVSYMKEGWGQLAGARLARLQHHHIPILLGPYGYTTYRGS